MHEPLLPVIVSTFERPGHLQRCLMSLERQRLSSREFEIIVSDDGSRDNTAAVVADFNRRSRVSCKFVTQQHQGFQKSKAVNAALRNASGAYLVLTDGDCIFAPDHLQQHMAARQRGVVWAGDAIRLNEEASKIIDLASIESGAWLDNFPKRLDWTLRRSYWKAYAYSAMGHSVKPKIIGNNFGVWRDALESINGFDESYVGWGCEDDDVGQRLRSAGQKVKTILGRTFAYHLWHAPDPTKPENWRNGANVDYFKRTIKLTRCLNGAQTTDFNRLSVRVVHGQAHALLAQDLRSRFLGASFDEDNTVGADLQILFWSGQETFSSKAGAKILVTDDRSTVPRSLRKRADCHLKLPGTGHSPRHQVDWLLAEISDQLGVPKSSNTQTVRKRAA